MGWSVPGYTAERLLGFGATGEVWSGQDDASGEPVALKRMRPGSVDGDRDRLRREAAFLAAFRHPNVIALRGVLGTDDGLVLVLDLAAGGSLTGVLARTGRLRSGEVVGFFAPLADALAAAHAVGLVHGDLSPGNLLLGADATPLVADLGTARLVGDDRLPVHATSRYLDPEVRAGAAPTAASDVYGLAAVAAHALTGRVVGHAVGAVQEWADHAHTLGVPAPLASALCAALARERRRRPTAGELAGALREACPAASLDRLLDPEVRAAATSRPAEQREVADPWAADPELATRQVRRPAVPASTGQEPGWPPRWLRHRWEQWRVSGLQPVAVRLGLLLAVVGLTAAAGWMVTGGHTDGTGSPTAAVSPRESAVARDRPQSDAQWRDVMRELDGRRSAAFARADAALLAQVHAPGSRALAEDTQAVRSLVAAGATAPGVRHEIRSVTVVHAGARNARLEVTDRMPGYRIVDARGGVLRSVPGRRDQTFQVDLVRTPAGWRITAIIRTTTG